MGDTPTPPQLRSGAVIGRGSIALRFVYAGLASGPCSLPPAPTGPAPPLASVALPLGFGRYYRPSAFPVFTSATFSLPSPSTAAPSLRTPSRLKPVGESGSPYRGFLFYRLRPTQGHAVCWRGGLGWWFGVVCSWLRGSCVATTPDAHNTLAYLPPPLLRRGSGRYATTTQDHPLASVIIPCSGLRILLPRRELAMGSTAKPLTRPRPLAPSAPNDRLHSGGRSR